ncbi:WD40-repeat-containing domain protein [Schizophyllum amplum]|uniref:WD40-repeat-containing domain protein n=1 Tax=Schizophyllum amplum TaxID=97359 RepID=A0A550CLF8_9AGAR|nr:WD40-repeat-containing domain protein [Auriculariopsis ampla]
MASEPSSSSTRDADAQRPGPSKLELMQRAIFSPFHKKNESTRILSDLAPVIMTPKMTAATVSAANSKQAGRPSLTSSDSRKVDFATIGRAPLRLGMSSRRLTSRDLQIVEATDELLGVDVPEPDGVASNISLLRGFNATIPSSEQGKTRRRQMRNVDTPRLGLKRLGLDARGLLTAEEEEHDVASDDDVVVVGRGAGQQKRKKKRRGRESLSAAKVFGQDELTRQKNEIVRDRENLHVRRSLINNEIDEITRKIATLDNIRSKLEDDLVKLQEDELELEDELEGVKERMDFEQSGSRQSSAAQPLHIQQSSRRRKGPAFLPSEHDDLPPGVAFMSLQGHQGPITALDFSEPYGTLVSAAQDEPQPIVWDLLTGAEIGRLRGHDAPVRCLQVEDHVCLTGGGDGDIRLWDLRRVDEDEEWGDMSVSEIEHDVDKTPRKPNGGIRNGVMTTEKVLEDGPCARILQGHSQAVTALYFEDECLVTGASDKTLRQWDLSTGQCVMTMDILWAMSHPHSSVPGGAIPDYMYASGSPAGAFAVPTAPYADGSWDMYQDFVGGVQFWGYGLVSGSGDGVVRMWDMRTGQAHRTLAGHTAPVTCLQFDELHIVSGSLDKTVRIWDLRTGGTFETLHYDYPVTALQFDTRKVVAAAGENGVKVYNRTSMQKSTLSTNGHAKPAERVRYMDRYMVTGGRDAMLKIWSL